MKKVRVGSLIKYDPKGHHYVVLAKGKCKLLDSAWRASITYFCLTTFKIYTRQTSLFGDFSNVSLFGFMWRGAVKSFDRFTRASSNFTADQYGQWRVQYIDGKWSKMVYKTEADTLKASFGGTIHYCRYYVPKEVK